MQLKFQRAKIKDVLQFYVDHYELEPGEKVVAFDSWLDPVKGEVCFELAVDQPKREKVKS